MSGDVGGSILDFLFFGSDNGGGPIGAALLVGAWLCGYLGWGYSLVFAATLSYYTYRYRTSRRDARRAVWSIQQCLQEPQVAQRVLGPDLPMWLKFPSVEKCVWLERVLTSLWPHIAKATETSLIESLNPTLEFYRPKFLTKLTMGTVKLGSIPLQITGIQSFRETDEETVIDMYCTWRGDPDIGIIASVGVVSVEARIHDFQLNGLLRIVLGPHCSVWPCFASMSLSFVGKPSVDFALKAAKIPFDAIPGLSAWLDGFLRNTLTYLMVFPKRLVIKILDEKQFGAQESSAEPVGTIHLTIHGCEDLHDKGFFTKLTTYATAEIVSGGESKGEKKTAVVKGKSPRFNSKFSFTVHNVPDERLIIKVLDDGHAANVVNKAAKTATVGKLNIGLDNLIGKVEIFVTSLIDTEYDATVRLVDPKRSTESIGRIHISTVFVPFRKVADIVATAESANAADDCGAPGSPGLRRAPSSLRGGAQADSRGNSAEAAAALSSSIPRGGGGDGDECFALTRQASMGALSGLLIVALDRCNDLVKSDFFGQADPYVVMTIGSNSAKSNVVYKSLSPVYNEKFELEVTSVQHDILEVRVYDKDIMRDEVIGKCSIPIAEVFRSNGKIRQSWRLAPQGTITLDLKLLTNGR